jgi:hypothetical protein
VYRHPYGRSPAGPGVQVDATDVERLADAWTYTLHAPGGHTMRQVAINRAAGLPDNAPAHVQDAALDRMLPVPNGRGFDAALDRRAAAFQAAYEQIQAELPPAPATAAPVDAWLCSARDAHQRGSAEWATIDRLIHDYRAHLRDGTPLDQPHTDPPEGPPA